MAAYYNDSDPFVCAWARELIKAGLVTDGEVDERPIQDVRPEDLRGFERCHFFSGILGWELALNIAGWSGPVWTGSCPCQPLSSAGKRQGHADQRHLWPAFHRLIAECRPPVVFGEQVASKDGREWFAGVRADLEPLGYACGAADLCAAGVGAPHIRQRLFWVADAAHDRHQRRKLGDEASPQRASHRDGQAQGRGRHDLADGGETCRRLAGSHGGQPRHGHLQPGGEHGQQPQDGGAGERVGDADSPAQERQRCQRIPVEPEQGARRSGDANPWANAVLIGCADGKARRVEPGIFPLADGVPNRVGTLRGAGNAICPQVAAEFIRAFVEAQGLSA